MDEISRVYDTETEGYLYVDSYELAQKFLTFVMPKSDAEALSHKLIETFDSFYDACNAPISKLCKIDGISETTARQIKIFPILVRAYRMSMYDKKHVFTDRHDVARYCMELLSGRKNEHFYILCFNSRNELTNKIHLAEGTPDMVNVPVRAVVEKVVNASTKKVVLAHNHPGGSMQPSPNDIQLTEQVKLALADIGVMLWEHIIVGKYRYSHITIDNSKK